MHNIVNGDRSASGECEISFRLCVVMWLERLTLSDANDTHRHVVPAPGPTAEQLFPLRFAPQSHLIDGPASPFQFIKVFGSRLHCQSAFSDQGQGLSFCICIRGIEATAASVIASPRLQPGITN
jgi:hypothetical protein